MLPLISKLSPLWFSVVTVTNYCNAGDWGLIPGLGRFPLGSSYPLGRFPLKKGMATHSSILAWRVPWTEEPGGPHSMGSQRVRHD